MSREGISISGEWGEEVGKGLMVGGLWVVIACGFLGFRVIELFEELGRMRFRVVSLEWGRGSTYLLVFDFWRWRVVFGVFSLFLVCFEVG